MNSRPARFSATLRDTTWLTGSRARISSSTDGGKRIGVRTAPNHHGPDLNRRFGARRPIRRAARPAVFHRRVGAMRRSGMRRCALSTGPATRGEREAGRYSGAYRGGECWTIAPAWAGAAGALQPDIGSALSAPWTATPRSRRIELETNPARNVLEWLPWLRIYLRIAPGVRPAGHGFDRDQHAQDRRPVAARRLEQSGWRQARRVQACRRSQGCRAAAPHAIHRRHQGDCEESRLDVKRYELLHCDS